MDCSCTYDSDCTKYVDQEEVRLLALYNLSHRLTLRSTLQPMNAKSLLSSLRYVYYLSQTYPK